MVEVTRKSRGRFRDLKPYCAPESLEVLRGPYHGRIDLPHRVRQRADRRGVDIDDPGGRRMAYQALPAEGRRRSGAPAQPTPPDRDVAAAQPRPAGARPVGEPVPRVEGRMIPYADRQRSIARAAIERDLGVDWRARAPVMLGIGPVLSPDDAVGNKAATLFSRGEARDYLDVDRIRRSGQYTDEQLLELAERADPGFDRKWFAHRLLVVDRIQQREVEPYGVTPQQLEDTKTRCRSWVQHLRE